MGVPAANLEETIAQYNASADAGEDQDFGRPGPLYPIVKPPFWAARWCRMAHDQCTGLRVNKKMQVVDQAAQWQPALTPKPSIPLSEEAVIPHLYAAGECTGGTGGAVRGSGKRGWYQVHGLVAGEGAAQEPSPGLRLASFDGARGGSGHLSRPTRMSTIKKGRAAAARNAHDGHNQDTRDAYCHFQDGVCRTRCRRRHHAQGESVLSRLL